MKLPRKNQHTLGFLILPSQYPSIMYANQVAEIQGFYGPFTLSERVIQKVWLRQDFVSTGLKTMSGKRLLIKDPGRWNVHEGPDFKEARLVLDDTELIGDVEVHLNLLDWHYHQHASDTNYDRVLLHVVLCLDSNADSVSRVQTSKGDTPELLYLLPLLEQDLESYAMEDALLELEQQDELEWVVRFLELPFEERIRVLKQRSLIRWQQKIAYAQQRLKTEDWETACHSYALEVLGYKRNRTPMLRLATRYPLVQMRKDVCEHQTLAAERRTGNTQVEKSGEVNSIALLAGRLFDEEAANWKLNGLRPANHPRRRLIQYLKILMKQPYWPDRLADYLKHFPATSFGSRTAAFRKAVELSELRAQLSESVFCSIISEKRFNTLTVDAILPLATAAGLLDGFDYWLHWFPGDCPAALQRFLKQAGTVNRQNPLNNGLIQGALGLFLDCGA